MGGAAGYDKLWRRLGSSACIFLPMILCHNPLMYAHLFALAFVLWGSWSYFGWLTPGDPKERWFNFFAAALVTQTSLLWIFFTWPRLIAAIIFALAGSLGKSWIDADQDGRILWWREDVLGELYYGFAMCFFVIINLNFIP